MVAIPRAIMAFSYLCSFVLIRGHIVFFPYQIIQRRKNR
jgi:hypothetical protein